jgi:predicted DNA-binding transcriptional regulator AlpA
MAEIPVAAMNTADAARYTAMSVAWLKLMRLHGDPAGPPFVVVGNRSVRYLKADLDDWLLSHRRAPAEAA